MFCCSPYLDRQNNIGVHYHLDFLRPWYGWWTYLKNTTLTLSLVTFNVTKLNANALTVLSYRLIAGQKSWVTSYQLVMGWCIKTPNIIITYIILNIKDTVCQWLYFHKMFSICFRNFCKLKCSKSMFVYIIYLYAKMLKRMRYKKIT